MYSVKTKKMQKKMLHQFPILIFLHLSLALSDHLPPNLSTNTTGRKSFSEAATIAKPGCQAMCGNLRVPYPFGIGLNSNCSINPSFDVNCKNSKPFISDGNIIIIDISERHVRIKNWVARTCYNETGNITSGEKISTNLVYPYSLSETNQFTLVGCDDLAMINGSSGRNITGGCLSVCSGGRDPIEGSCTGIGCCQTSIPKGLKNFTAEVTSFQGHTKVYSFNPCSYAFVAEKEKFQFRKSNLWDTNFMNWTIENVPRVLDWAIGNLTCDKAKKSRDYACRKNSDCEESDTGLGGYRCSCLDGYEGNPYIDPGCTDIDECQSYPCHEHGLCTNNPGSYTCSCAKGYEGDGKKDCIAVNSKLLVIKVSIGLTIGLLSVFIGITWLYFGIKKRKLTRMREKFFEQNGDFSLKRQTSICG